MHVFDRTPTELEASGECLPLQASPLGGEGEKPYWSFGMWKLKISHSKYTVLCSPLPIN